MKDKPIPAKIFLTMTDENSIGEDFIGLSGELYRQNLIFSEPRDLRVNKSTLELTVVFRDIISFSNWIKNENINESWSRKFDKLLTDKPKTIKESDVILEVDNVHNCNCENSDFYILQGRSFHFKDELTCNKCFGQVPYSKVPIEIEIEDWQTKYERIYSNWLESTLFEKEALEELTNYNKGKLNLTGEKIRKQLSNFFKIPIYMNYFVEEPDENQNCPICGDEGVDSGLIRPSKICKKCNSIFYYGDS